MVVVVVVIVVVIAIVVVVVIVLTVVVVVVVIIALVILAVRANYNLRNANGPPRMAGCCCCWPLYCPYNKRYYEASTAISHLPHLHVSTVINERASCAHTFHVSKAKSKLQVRGQTEFNQSPASISEFKRSFNSEFKQSSNRVWHVFLDTRIKPFHKLINFVPFPIHLNPAYAGQY